MKSPQQSAIDSFKQKFLGKTPKSSQINTRMGPRFYDMLDAPRTSETHHRAGDRAWQLNRNVPTPCYVGSHKFKTNADRPLEIKNSFLNVRVPRDAYGDDEGWNQTRFAQSPGDASLIKQMPSSQRS